MGIKVVMLTGDNQITAAAIGKQAGVDQVIAGVLPGEKEKEIRRLGETGKVAMVGDGISINGSQSRHGYRHRSRVRCGDRCGRCRADEEQ